ncbi:uncharacterized protein LOC126737720 [Anthonomus grandis grandis]|uniref:uncharacterized protein LOC126737720 n=1 Tax=Anthonomus grandis grandis TaxID=2921223 RepID=UPI0021656DE0|nr:uncharacterized protein LOC126737720 [Anthonomus grandis grandis]
MEEIPQNIREKAIKATENLLPVESRQQYEREYGIFGIWKDANAIVQITETVLMAYFQKLSEKYSPNSLWTKCSTLRSTVMVYKNIDISQFHRLISFLKVKSKGYVPKKSKVLEEEQIIKFIKKAPDIYLVHKVILVMGVFGGLRRDELVKMTIDDIEDRGTVLAIKVPETKTSTSKSFTIIEEDLGALNLIKNYAALRPAGIKERRFFLTYRKSRCTVQPVGKNIVGSVPTLIAKFLKLGNAEAYTGHCLRRTSQLYLLRQVLRLKC